MEVFTIRNLTFAYPEQEKHALSDLTLSVQPGEFLVLCGPSGCGKSTLLRQLKTVLAPQGRRSGEILFDGKNLDELPQREQAEKIGFVQQSPENQIVTDKVWHELAFGLESLGYDTPTIRRRVAEMASFFGIQTWFYKSVTELSGVINEFLQVFGADKIDWLKSDYCMVVIVVLFLWKNLGYNMILFMAALSNIPRELLEVAEVEGASAAYQFFHIKLRYLSPTVLFVTILSIINSFKVFREIYLLTGNYPYDGLYMMQHFMNNMFNSADYQRLSAAAVLLAIVIVILIALLFFVENIFGKDVEG